MSVDVKVYREKVDLISKDLSHGPLRVLYCQDVSKLTNEVERLLAERDATQRAVEWTPLADGKACAAEVEDYLVEVRPSHDGWWGWKAEQAPVHRDRQHGHARTKEMAQEAAIRAARKTR